MGALHVAVACGVFVFGQATMFSQASTFVQRLGFDVTVTSLALFFVLSWLTAISYLRVSLSDPGRPSDLQGPHIEHGRTRDGVAMKICRRCGCFKPERCHHCADCKACTIKMDHHCSWANNCIGFGNYKFYLLLLAYASGTAIVAVTVLGLSLAHSAPAVPPVPPPAPPPVPPPPPAASPADDTASVVCIVMASFVVVVTLPMLCVHLWLVWHNQTSVEALSGIPIETYDAGHINNLKQVLGENTVTWAFPCVHSLSATYDGIHWTEPGLGPEYREREPSTIFSTESASRASTDALSGPLSMSESLEVFGEISATDDGSNPNGTGIRSSTQAAQRSTSQGSCGLVPVGEQAGAGSEHSRSEGSDGEREGRAVLCASDSFEGALCDVDAVKCGMPEAVVLLRSTIAGVVKMVGLGRREDWGQGEGYGYSAVQTEDDT